MSMIPQQIYEQSLMGCRNIYDSSAPPNRGLEGIDQAGQQGSLGNTIHKTSGLCDTLTQALKLLSELQSTLVAIDSRIAGSGQNYPSQDKAKEANFPSAISISSQLLGRIMAASDTAKRIQSNL